MTSANFIAVVVVILCLLCVANGDFFLWRFRSWLEDRRIAQLIRKRERK